MAHALEQPKKPHLVIEPTHRWGVLNLGELWQFRDLLLTLASRDIKLRYRQTLLGAAWVVLQPLLAAGLLSFIFEKVAGMASPHPGVPFFLFTFSAQIALTAFSGTLSKASVSLVANSGLVSKVFFPRMVLPLSTVLSNLIDFGVSFGLLLVLLLSERFLPGLRFLLLPVWLLLILLLASGFGLIAAALMVRYRDVQHILPVFISFLPLANPIGFTVARIPEHLQPAYLLVNPLAALLEAFRWSVLGYAGVPWGYVGYAAVFAVVLFLVGVQIFQAMERQFADVI